MSCLKRKGGWKIKLESGRLLPKIYKTLGACQKRTDELKRHGSGKDKSTRG